MFIRVHLWFNILTERNADLDWNSGVTETYKHISCISARVIGCAFQVSNTLGTGFLEKIYENALAHELRKAGLGVSQQHRVAVMHDGIVVGDYAADLLIEGLLVVELNASGTWMRSIWPNA